jgi:hypothetical protein
LGGLGSCGQRQPGLGRNDRGPEHPPRDAGKDENSSGRAEEPSRPDEAEPGTDAVGQGLGADRSPAATGILAIDIVIGNGDHSLPPRLCATSGWRTVGRDVGESDASATSSYRNGD